MTSQVASYLDAIAHLPPGGTLVLVDISWGAYEELVAGALGPHVRVAYDRGRLEIMTPSAKHEKYKEMILRIADAVADELGCELETFGSTTLKLPRLARGAEPDTCFYVQHAAQVADADAIDLESDPPPDVVVEVDIAHSSADKIAFYDSLGIPEVWRYDGRRLTILIRTESGFVEAAHSSAFPLLTSDAASRFLERSKSESKRAVLRSVREWLRERR